MPTESSTHAESPSMDAELNLTNSETESDEEASKINARNQEEGQAGPNPGVQDDGQAGPNLGVQDEGQAGPNPGIAVESQLQSSHVVHAGPNLEHMVLGTSDALTQQKPEQMDEDSTGTLSSLQNIDKDLSFTDQFFVEKTQEEEPGKTNAEAEVSQVVDEIVTDAVDWAMQAPLRARFRDLPTKSLELDHSNQRLADQEETRRKRRKRRDVPRTPHVSPPSQPPSPPPLACASSTPGTSGASGSSQLSSPPPPPSTGTSGSAQQQGSKAPSSYESAGVSGAQELSPTDSLMHEDSIPNEQERPATPEPAWIIPSSNVSDVENNWASALVSTSETPAENSLLAKTGDMTTFMKWFCRQMSFTFSSRWKSVTRCSQIRLTGRIRKDQVRINVNRPLPLGGLPGHEKIQTYFFFNKDLEYLRYGSKGSSLALSISKMKAISYPHFGLELLVSEHMWIDDVCTYDINAKYDISHWWFNRKKFYIDRHDSPSRRKEVRTHMRILSVNRVKAYLRYGYDYLCEIILRRADFQEHTIAEKDFKNLYPSDFEDLNLLLLQGHLDHLPGSDKWMLSTAVKLWTRNLVIRQRVKDFQLGLESYQTQLNLTKPGWNATGYEFKHDYTIIESPRAIVFPVNNNERKIMRFNEIYKFSDGTLTHILEALDYIVK
ncbi:hypothetical protein Tco_0369962 [Tanacetum coccineum]